MLHDLKFIIHANLISVMVLQDVNCQYLEINQNKFSDLNIKIILDNDSFCSNIRISFLSLYFCLLPTECIHHLLEQ